jgi:hypothetical protein
MRMATGSFVSVDLVFCCAVSGDHAAMLMGLSQCGQFGGSAPESVMASQEPSVWVLDVTLSRRGRTFHTRGTPVASSSRTTRRTRDRKDSRGMSATWVQTAVVECVHPRRPIVAENWPLVPEVGLLAVTKLMRADTIDRGSAYASPVRTLPSASRTNGPCVRQW